MLNKIFLFMLISIILGFIISYYYNRNFKGPFVLYFIICSVILFILFYFLGNCKNDVERFSTNIFLSEEEESRNFPSEEESRNVFQSEEESRNIFQSEEESLNIFQSEEESRNIFQSEEESRNIPSEEHHLISGNYAQLEEEEDNIQNISDNSLNSSSTTPLSTSTNGNNPININISYNSQNSINELDNNESRLMKTPVSNNSNSNSNSNSNINNNILANSEKKYINRNLGLINPKCDDSVGSRINTDGDWIYGKQAWTNNPDFYTPEEYIKQTYKRGWNEMTEANKYRKNTDVCPLMANVPWTEYKSGDSEPEPYNVK